MSGLTHFDDQGRTHMVDVSGKPTTTRYARARAIVEMQPETFQLIRDVKIAKGNVIEVARLAGITAAKRTADLIPLCHPLPLTSVEVDFSFQGDCQIVIEASIRVTAQTGAEMEALVSATAAALTIYDMCKAVDRSMTIHTVRLEEKSGGKSGHFVRKELSE